MGRTLEEISEDIIRNKKRIVIAKTRGCDFVEIGGFLQLNCKHDDLVVIGNTTAGDKVEVCSICGFTKYATYGQKGDLIKGSPKVDVREYGLSFLYPAYESIILEAVQEMTLDGSKTNPEMDMPSFLETGAAKLIPYYLESAREERKRLAEIKEQARVKRKIISDHFVGIRRRER